MQEGNDNLSEKPKRKTRGEDQNLPTGEQSGNQPGPPTTNPVGRPRLEIDTASLEKLAAMQCTMAEMAAFFDCHVDTLRDNFSNIIKNAQEKGRASLRREQYLVAMGPRGKDNPGKVTMLIWLGKQLLGQRERADLDIQSGVTVVWDERIGKL